MGTKISALAAAAALSGTEVVPGVQSAGNVKITMSQIRIYALTGIAAIASTGSGADLVNGSVSLNKLANIANNSVLGNVSGGSAAPAALTAQQVALLASNPVTSQAGASYTGVLADGFSFIRFTNAGAVTFTVPTNASVPYPIGTVIEFEQAGAGTVTATPAGGVTINSRGGVFNTAGQFAIGALKKVGTDTWTLAGDLA